MEQVIKDFKMIEETFDKEDILSYKIFLIKMYENFLYFKEKEINLTQKEDFIISFENFLISQGLNKMISIHDLNYIFEPNLNDININDKKNYIILFNIMLEEFRSEDNLFSFKVEEIILKLIEKITDEINNNTIDNTTIENNVDIIDVNIVNTISNNELYPKFKEKIKIKNKDYLKEYIIRKNLLEYKCNNCGLSSWQNEPLMLFLHSKNNIYTNENLNNLEFLCPNCYSQLGE